MRIDNKTAYSTTVLEQLAKMGGGDHVHAPCEVRYFHATRKHHSAVYETAQGILGTHCMVKLFWNTDSKRSGRSRWHNGEPWHIEVVPPEELGEGCTSAMEQVALMGGVAPLHFALQFLTRVFAINNNNGRMKKWFTELPSIHELRGIAEMIDSSHRVPFYANEEGVQHQRQHDVLAALLRTTETAVKDRQYDLDRAEKAQVEHLRRLEDLKTSIPLKREELEAKKGELEEVRLKLQAAKQLLESTPNY